MKNCAEKCIESASMYRQLNEDSIEEIQIQTLVKDLYTAKFSYRHIGTLEIEGFAYFLTEELKKYTWLNLTVSRKQVGDVVVNFPSGLQQATIYIEDISIDSKVRKEAICFELDGSIHISESVKSEMKPIIVQAFNQWLEWLNRLCGDKLA